MLLVANPFAARAEAPPTFTGPDTTWSTTGVVAEPHVNATCAADPSAAQALVEAACPTYTIQLDGEDTSPLRYLDVRLDMTSVAAGRGLDDYDLQLYNAAGTQVASAGTALGSREVMAVNHLPDGEYTIRVVPYTNVPDSTFTLTVRYRTRTS